MFQMYCTGLSNTRNSMKRGRTRQINIVLWRFLIHQALSTVGILVGAGFLTFSLESPQNARRVLTETPYFPMQIFLAACVGFALRRRLRHPVMEWVWVLPLFALCLGFSITDLPFSVRLERFFGWGCRPELRCFDQLGLTLPFYTAAAYSLAPYISRHVVKIRPYEQRSKNMA